MVDPIKPLPSYVARGIRRKTRVLEALKVIKASSATKSNQNKAASGLQANTKGVVSEI